MVKVWLYRGFPDSPFGGMTTNYGKGQRAKLWLTGFPILTGPELLALEGSNPAFSGPRFGLQAFLSSQGPSFLALEGNSPAFTFLGLHRQLSVSLPGFSVQVLAFKEHATSGFTILIGPVPRRLFIPALQ